ncbi:GNAT family N-acetyltransferase [uncultured Porphyromonas sp.]|uniref:GNAT family N-acetyltransferase n=1 Tax=uncultured Porphyromonas sp. TaxID=159274 RepID=UPI00262FA638|nr:GNAT family N-acetyltransferase [uncultured Porphyromonas sp.]
MIRLHPYDGSDSLLRSSILSLLSEAFGKEGQPYYELAMEYLYDGEHTFLLSEGDGALLAVALVVDYVDPDKGRWAYLYSFATREDRRGEGLMTGLYKEAIEPRLIERGYRGACLVPATSSLVSFYKGWGFHLLRDAEDAIPITPGQRATDYLIAAYGQPSIDNPLPFRMIKPFVPTVDHYRLVSPLD